MSSPEAIPSNEGLLLLKFCSVSAVPSAFQRSILSRYMSPVNCVPYKLIPIAFILALSTIASLPSPSPNSILWFASVVRVETFPRLTSFHFHSPDILNTDTLAQPSVPQPSRVASVHGPADTPSTRISNEIATYWLQSASFKLMRMVPASLVSDCTVL